MPPTITAPDADVVTTENHTRRLRGLGSEQISVDDVDNAAYVTVELTLVNRWQAETQIAHTAGRLTVRR